MSLKENIDMVKEELNSEEKFFESAVKAERFVKKYRNAIIGVVSGIVVVVIGNALYQANEASNTEAANAAYASLLANPGDDLAAAELQKRNPELHDIWALSRAVSDKDEKALAALSASKAPGVADIASYELAAITKDLAKLDAYGFRQDAIYKDLAIVENAYLLMESGKVDEARSKLDMVPRESALYQVAELMKHYGVK